jgi:CheY-specific phosphatase CheX
MNPLPSAVADAFRLAAITALQELVQVEVFPEDALPEQGSGQAVIATIELLRESPGKLSFVLSESTAAALAARYLPAGITVTAEMVDDVAGEFANVIAGQAKTMLKGTHYHFRQSTPAVTRGKPLYAGSAEPNHTIRFSTESGTIQLCIDL